MSVTIYLPLIGNFFLVLWVVGNIFALCRLLVNPIQTLFARTVWYPDDLSLFVRPCLHKFFFLLLFSCMKEVRQLFKTNFFWHMIETSVGKVVETTLSGSFESPQQQQGNYVHTAAW